MVGGAGGAGVGSGVLVVLVVHRARRRGSAGVQAVHAKRNRPLPRWEHVGSGVDRGGHWGRGLERAAPAREDEETTRVGSPAEAVERRIGLGSTLMPTAGSAFSWSIFFLMAAPYAVVGAAGGWLFYLYRRAPSRRGAHTRGSGRVLRILGRGLCLRCPRCGRAALYAGWFAMHPRCEAVGSATNASRATSSARSTSTTRSPPAWCWAP